MAQVHTPDSAGRMLDRMLFFSDAVFAIVLTLLVLDLRPPEITAENNAAVWSMLWQMQRAIFAFFISFALVGLWWSVHMRIHKALRQFDWPVAVLNFLFLLTVTLMPFASALISGFGNTAPAWELYWGVNAASSLFLALLGLATTRGGGRLIGGMTGAARFMGFVRNIAPGLCFAAGVAFAATEHLALSRWCWLPIPFIMVIMPRIQRRF